MGFLGLWTIAGGNLTPAQTAAAVLVTSAGGTLGFYDTAPVAQQAKAPTPAADPAQLKNSFDLLQEALAAYGLIV